MANLIPDNDNKLQTSNMNKSITVTHKPPPPLPPVYGNIVKYLYVPAVSGGGFGYELMLLRSLRG